jgi:glucosamine--fructose-6-phosphate aminotransferase (isomerizing)
VLVTGRSDIAASKGLAVVHVPPFGSPVADAILQILPAQLLVADMADAAGLTDMAFRYRQTDTKVPPKG